MDHHSDVKMAESGAFPKVYRGGFYSAFSLRLRLLSVVVVITVTVTIIILKSLVRNYLVRDNRCVIELCLLGIHGN